MEIKELERAFQAASRPTADDEEQHALAVRLIESDAPEIIAYHYELLRKRDNKSLFHWLRNTFAKRGRPGEEFLIRALDEERDPEMLATVVHILGRMRSGAARESAICLLTSEQIELRDTAIYVLGWVGSASDVSLLEERLLSDSAPNVRGDAATVYSQLVYRLPASREPAVKGLHRALRQETDKDVLASILVSLQYILHKRWGMREDIEEGTITGDVAKARAKALKFLGEP